MNLRYCYLTEGMRPDVICVFGHRPWPGSEVEQPMHCRVERAVVNAKAFHAMDAVRKVERKLRAREELRQEVVRTCLEQRREIA